MCNKIQSSRKNLERKMVKLKIYVQYEDDSDESKNMRVKVVVPRKWKSLTCERIKKVRKFSPDRQNVDDVRDILTHTVLC